MEGHKSGEMERKREAISVAVGGGGGGDDREDNNQDGQTRRVGRRREGRGMGNKEKMTKIEGGVVMMEIGGGKAETGGKEIIGGTEN